MGSWHLGDTHAGHDNIGNFRKIPQEFLDATDSADQANRLWLESFWNKNVTKRCTVYIYGDAAFSEDAISWMAGLPGRKILFAGNHDELPTTSYLRAFDQVRGCYKSNQKFWQSHFPPHPNELRGKKAVHGHVHYKSIDDPRYLNVSCDNLFERTGQPMLEIGSIRKTFAARSKGEIGNMDIII